MHFFCSQFDLTKRNSNSNLSIRVYSTLVKLILTCITAINQFFQCDVCLICRVKFAVKSQHRKCATPFFWC